MNTLSLISLFICVVTTTSVVLPTLNVIKRITFKYPYSCQPGPATYENCALFLTEEGAQRNAPDLLYDGACRGVAHFDVMLSGDDFGLLTDLGDVPLENVTASKAFNYVNIFGEGNNFINTVSVVNRHTYAAVLAKSLVRGLLVFRVENFEQDGPATIAYAVKQYGLVQQVDEAPGFSWNATNH